MGLFIRTGKGRRKRKVFTSAKGHYYLTQSGKRQYVKDSAVRSDGK